MPASPALVLARMRTLLAFLGLLVVVGVAGCTCGGDWGCRYADGGRCIEWHTCDQDGAVCGPCPDGAMCPAPDAAA